MLIFSVWSFVFRAVFLDSLIWVAVFGSRSCHPDGWQLALADTAGHARIYSDFTLPGCLHKTAEEHGINQGTSFSQN